MKPINVLSLFDGISCGQIALARAGIPVANYYASEIDKHAIKVTQHNWPETIQLGDVTQLQHIDWLNPKIDLLIGGSPCQGFSFAGKQLNFNDPRSALFFEYVRILKEIQAVNPDVKFFLENVVMKQQFQDVISFHLGVKPVLVNSALVSAQNRKRLYWTNIEGFKVPDDKGILLRDIVLDDVEPVVLHNLHGGFNEDSVRVFENKSPTIRTAAGGGHIPSFVKKDFIHTPFAIDYMNRQTKDGRSHWDFKHHSDIKEAKSSAVVANFFKGVPYNVFKDYDCIRKFHPVECERLQTVPDNYTNCGISNTQRYRALGNGWTVDVIAEFFKPLAAQLKSENVA